MSSSTLRTLGWLAAGLASLLALPLLALLASAVLGWNWARAPLQDWSLRQTGRVLHIGGDLDVRLAWPWPRVRAQALSFANPPWVATPWMVVAEQVDVSLDLPALLRGQLAFPELRLRRAQVFLEQAAGGRKNWLLDTKQTDDSERIAIGRVLLDEGQVHYIDAAQHTAIVAFLSTAPDAVAGGPAAVAPDGVHFKAHGQFKGQALAAAGNGGAVMAWRDETHPYPLAVQATLGPTRAQFTGTVTGLHEWRALDLQVDFSGDSLSSLYTLTGVTLPPTPAYRSQGRLVRDGPLWRYGPFAGQVGHSDLAGTLQLQSGRARPLLSGALQSRQLDLADLGPAVGARTDTRTRVLPDLPFDTARWAHMDADVTVRAQKLLRDKARLVDTLQLHLTLQDRLLHLDPLSFGIAGGEFSAQAELDARTQPLGGHLRARLRGLAPGQLLQAVDPRQNGLGRLDGDLDLRGQGASIGHMLATAQGHLHLAAGPGRVSRLLMEQTGLHLLEILSLNLFGDQTVAMNCARLSFTVARGVMQADTLVLDTAVNTLVGSGHINLAQESLDLTIVPRTKVGSIVALRSPIHVTGSLGEPVVALDRGRLAARGVGALVLGLVNPLLALVPLVDTGPGVQGACTPPVLTPLRGLASTAAQPAGRPR